MPALLPELSQSPGRSGFWPFHKLSSSHSSTRKLAPAPSMSALSNLPSVDRCAPPFSTGAVADNVSPPSCKNAISAVLKQASEGATPAAMGSFGCGSVGGSRSSASTRDIRRELQAAPGGCYGSPPAYGSPPINSLYDRPVPVHVPLVATSMPATSQREGPGHTALRSGSAAAAIVTAATAGQAGDRGVLLAACGAAPEAMRRPMWRLADYVIGGRIYKGEVSSVYKAVCHHSGLKVVLKVYSLGRVADNALHTLVREVRIHTELAHDNVLMMYGVFVEENRLVLVLERALRGDLLAVRSALPRGRMSEDQLRVLVLAPLLEALVYLHGRGVCHRDIKPENLLMTATWQLRMADFGAAIDLTQERAVTRTGTMEYMAPEVERCPLKMLPEDNKDNPELAYTTAVDVWSVGVLAYEMLVGFPPFIDVQGQTPMAGAAGEGPRELHFPHFVSAGGQDFISLALAERPGDRPTAVQLLRHPWLKHAVRQHHTRQQQQQQAERQQQQQAERQQQQQQAERQQQQQAERQQQQAEQQQQLAERQLAERQLQAAVAAAQQQMAAATESPFLRFSSRLSRAAPREGLSRLHLSSGLA